MSRFNVPIRNPKPDIERFLKIMKGEIVPDKPPLVEYLVDNAVMRPIIEDLLGRTWVDTSDKTEYMGGQMDFSKENLRAINAWLDNQIAFWYHMGYDFIRCEVSLPLPAVSLVTKDTALGHEALNRAWQGLHDGPIKTWEDFEKYPWPEVTEQNFYIHRYICDHLPDGFGFITCHAGGVYEHASRVLGYENLCIMIHEDPALLRAVVDRLGEIIQKYNAMLLELDGLSVIFQGDDFGFKTQTLISPDQLKEFIFPWHKKYAEMIHAHGKPYFLHSCGEVSRIMEALIEDVKIDGKHSFEDGIMSAAEAKRLYGDRICILGGIDVDKLTRYTPEDLRRHVRKVMEECGRGGRFAVGAGNSIPSYIPLENYLSMVDEALR
jgi:uroporphyrinogen decarboxylase